MLGRAKLAAADATERSSIGNSYYLALFTGQRQTDRLMMRNKSDVEGRRSGRAKPANSSTSRKHHKQSKPTGRVIPDEGNRVMTRTDQRAAMVRTASSMALILHELATNAIKYGALGQADGKLMIGWNLLETFCF